MYTKNSSNNNSIAVSSFELENCLEGADIYDSALLYNLSTQKGLTREPYHVKDNWYRPDLIAKEVYGDTRYEAFVILQAGSIKNIRPGAILELIPKEEIKLLRNES